MEPATLGAFDVFLIVAYFLMVALVGLAFCVRERRKVRAGGDNASSTDDFFLAGRSMRWPSVGLSLFVSNIGSEHMLGLAGSAAKGGIAVGWYEWSAGLHILVLGWLFAPIYIRSGIATLPEYLERRYSKRMRAMLSFISLFIYVFTKLSVSVFSGATVLRSVFGWNRELSAVGLVLLTALYTAMGGLAAVIVTDVAQSAVLLVGAACMAAVGFGRVGGLSALEQDPPPNVNATEWSSYFHMYRPLDDPDYPTLGMLLGTNVGGLWYWCLDQAIVQRVLSSRSLGHARASTIFAGFLKVTPVFLMVMPGLVARRLFNDELTTLDENGRERWNEALPIMMKQLLPPGLLGLNLAATVAACMSSLDSVFTAAASLFCLDLYHGYMRKGATERELVLVGRVFCAFLAVVTIAWLPVIDLMSDQVFVYIQSISMYLSPPIVSVYFCGALWKRANAPGAVAAFVVGYSLGFGRMLGEIVCKLNPPPAGSAADALFVRMNYLYVGTLLFLFSVTTQILVTLCTQPPSKEQIEGLTVDWSRCAWPRCCQRAAAPATRMISVEAMGAGAPGVGAVAASDVGVEMGAVPAAGAKAAAAAESSECPTQLPTAASRRPKSKASAWGDGSEAWLEGINVALSAALVVIIVSLGAAYM